MGAEAFGLTRAVAVLPSHPFLPLASLIIRLSLRPLRKAPILKNHHEIVAQYSCREHYHLVSAILLVPTLEAIHIFQTHGWQDFLLSNFG